MGKETGNAYDEKAEGNNKENDRQNNHFRFGPDKHWLTLILPVPQGDHKNARSDQE